MLAIRQSTFFVLFAFALVFACAVPHANALYARVDAVKVPVERLAANLEKAIENDPKNAKAVLNLARLHAMAYSLRTEEAPIDPKRPDAVWFGYEPKFVPFAKVTATDDKEKLRAAQAHLDAALKYYEKAVTLSPNDPVVRLGYGWLLSQTDKKADAIAALRKVVDESFVKENKTHAGNQTITAECVGYLVPLLDPVADKTEIMALNEKAAATLKKLQRFVTPIAVPLRDGLAAGDIEDRSARVAFDADGSGHKKSWTWINRDAAWLVHDPKKTGKIESALQMFGSVSFWLFWETGYDALAALDDNGDGQLTGPELAGLALWHDANGNGVSEPGEVKSLAEYGIVAVSCAFECDAAHADHIAFSRRGVTFSNGRTRPTFDLVLHGAK
jgi:tetratricopeptide (TPR) repeat protein